MAPVLLRTAAAAGSIMKFLDLKNRWLNYKVSPSSLQFQNFFPPFQLTCAATTTTSFLSLSSFQQSSEATKYATGSSVSPFQISFNFHSLCSFLLSKKTYRLLTFLSQHLPCFYLLCLALGLTMLRVQQDMIFAPSEKNAFVLPAKLGFQVNDFSSSVITLRLLQEALAIFAQLNCMSRLQNFAQHA